LRLPHRNNIPKRKEKSYKLAALLENQERR